MTHQLLVLISKNTLGLLLDEKLDFSHRIKEKLGKNMKRVNVSFPDTILLQLKLHLDYGDMQLQSMQYSAGLAITEAMKGTSQAKLLFHA